MLLTKTVYCSRLYGNINGRENPIFHNFFLGAENNTHTFLNLRLIKYLIYLLIKKSHSSGSLAFLIILYTVTIGGSIYGNVLVMWIVKTTKALQNVNNLYVANLAFTDIILSTVVTPFHFHAALKQRWDLPEFMCKVCPFVQNVCVNAQILSLILIAKDR